MLTVNCSHDLGSEIALLLLQSKTDLEARHLDHIRPALLQQYFSTVRFGSLTNGWPVSAISFRYLRNRPSTIFAVISGALPSPAAWSRRIPRSRSTISAGTSAGRMYCGLTAATCMAMSLASASFPPFNATRAPIRVPCTYAPSVVGALTVATRRTLMFSPIFATSARRRSSSVSPVSVF